MKEIIKELEKILYNKKEEENIVDIYFRDKN